MPNAEVIKQIQEALATPFAAERLGPDAKVEEDASMVSGSPYRYVYVFLTDRGPDGPYVLLSEESEFADGDGILVGGYECYDSEATEVDTFPDVPSAVHEAGELAKQLLAEEAS